MSVAYLGTEYWNIRSLWQTIFLNQSAVHAGSNSTVSALTQQLPSTTWSAYEPDVIFWHTERFAGGLDQCVLFVLTSVIASWTGEILEFRLVLSFVVGEICFLQRGFITELKTISARDSLLNVILALNPNGSSKWFLVLRNWGNFWL